MIGTGASARFRAIQNINNRRPRKFELPKGEKGQDQRLPDYFGQNCFDLRKMRERLPKSVFQQFVDTVEKGDRLDLEIADTVAAAVKAWATEQGATHFCHWFQPQTGSTAEKHDAFLDLDRQGLPVENFTGSQLIQSEPDASSFPSGGMRTTFEARGYTAWDPSSPMFVMESTNGKTLCIPSAFISYHGQALDKKTVLMRSSEALSEQACRLLGVIGEKGVGRVVPTLGTEQEYFLVDREFYSLRPDLVMCGRTLVGAQPPRGQQLEDHYFGSITSRVQAYMQEVEVELYKLGVPIKTRHNEVAPSQFETAPIFREANVAVDHNQVVMEMLKKVAKRHGYEVILHEKPFAGMNGSGKHCNWSLQMAASGDELNGTNLLDPGVTPFHNLRFLLFLVSVLKGVHQHSGLLRAGIATCGNDHRLGANEAPPAIISVFLGQTLDSVLNHLEAGDKDSESAEGAMMSLGVSQLPRVHQDNTDRNRTSPFAFTGNKFEFRAVGSNSSPALPAAFLNAAVADGLRHVTDQLESHLKAGKSLDAAASLVLKETITATKAIRFEGNNYSDEWQVEAKKRGLPNLRKTPESLEQLLSESSKSLLTGFKILSDEELESRFNVRLERYIKNMIIEVETQATIIDTQIIPAVMAYYGRLSETASQSKLLGVPTPQTDLLKRMAGLIQSLQEKRSELDNVIRKIESLESDELKLAHFLASDGSQAMEGVRAVSDELEAIVADDYWPLPKYREMLFL